MKNKIRFVLAAAIGCILTGLSFPTYAYASDGEDYITISVDAVDDNANLQYALDSDDESAFTSSNEFTVPAGTSHTIYVKDAAGNITSQKYEPEETRTYTPTSYGDDEQQINIDLELGRKEGEEIYSTEEKGNPGTASVTDRTKTDGSVDAEKVFFTFTTKEGEELYLVVDQGRGTDNVYLLDTVSLGDLRALADGQETSSTSDDKKEDNLLSILAEENANSEPEELQTSPKEKSSFSTGLVILLFALIGGGIYYYFKIYRTKKDEAMDAMDAMDMDEFAPEEEEEEEVDFDYDDAEKEEYLDKLINGDSEEEEYYDQDPEAYATSHMQDEGEASDSEDDSDDEDMFAGMDDI